MNVLTLILAGGQGSRLSILGEKRAKSRHRTKPGALLKSQIPIRTWADWNEDRPGFVESDWVGHDGGNLRGEHCLTLDVADIKIHQR